MKNIIILSIIALLTLQLGNTTPAQASSVQVLEIQGAPSNFTKAKFHQLFVKAGITQQMNVNGIIKSLHKKSNGKWYCTMTANQIGKVNSYSNGKLKVIKGVVVIGEEGTTI